MLLWVVSKWKCGNGTTINGFSNYKLTRQRFLPFRLNAWLSKKQATLPAACTSYAKYETQIKTHKSEDRMFSFFSHLCMVETFDYK